MGEPAHRAGSRLLMPLIAATVLVIDQVTKWWALHKLGDDRMIDLVWTLRLNLVRNPGAAFSTGRGLGPLLGLAAVVIVIVLIRLGRVFRSPPTLIALGAVLGGALGNLVDRAVRDGSGGLLGGHVIDFIDIQWWPVWNVADMAIVCGGIALAWLTTRTEGEPVTDAASPAGAPPETEAASPAEVGSPTGAGSETSPSTDSSAGGDRTVERPE
jgi:signal peptidase II